MGRYKIIYDLENCIGVFACVAAHEKRWLIGKDEFEGKAVLVGAKQDEKTGFYEVEIEDDELEINLEAARVCPVNVIHIVDKQTGKQLV